MRKKNFVKPEQEKKVIQTKLLAYIINNLFTLFWFLVLIIGGALLIHYYASIRYLPDYDFQSGVFVVTAIAAIAILITLMIMFLLVIPGIIWSQYWGKNSPLKPHENNKAGDLTDAFFLFLVPVLLLDNCFCIWLVI